MCATHHNRRYLNDFEAISERSIARIGLIYGDDTINYRTKLKKGEPKLKFKLGHFNHRSVVSPVLALLLLTIAATPASAWFDEGDVVG